MLKPFVNTEFDRLQVVILGISNDFGGCPTIDEAYDPKSKEHILNGKFPLEKDLKSDLNQLSEVFKKYDIKTFRPLNIFACNQVFSRDIGFVIDNKFFIANTIDKRRNEIQGLEFVLKNISSNNIQSIPENIFIEGGDVLVLKNHLFVGFSNDADFEKYEVSRTNRLAIDFLKDKFPDKNILGFQLKKSDNNPSLNCLHLDCCFQPLGLGHLILYPDGFKLKSDLTKIIKIFGESNIIEITQNEMYNMYSNVFSISKDIVVSDIKFKRLNNLLVQKGYKVEEVSFSEVSKMGGLFRCSTLPIIRQNHYE
ncbi:MAG: amidinotransferase [Flavobacteriales bacterium]|nr:amidinotransferase [Flavobacteriales bacterium]|tara:strand:- start:6453 stop:7379 length:927 start_codon:yes stop_codon:yes gene_type:complete